MRASYLASPPLVVAYALAGRVDIDLTTEPLGEGADGPVYLKDIWPTQDEVAATLATAVDRALFEESYGTVFEGDERWRALPVPDGQTYAWDGDSTYVQQPPFFSAITPEPAPVTDIVGARVLAVLGDSVTTDHISPAGSIPASSPAGRYLIEHGVEPRDFNSYGVAARQPRGDDARHVREHPPAQRPRPRARRAAGPCTSPPGRSPRSTRPRCDYQAAGTPLIVLAGREYGNGSSRDWAAKGTLLLGVRAVIAESFERIHRSNLVGMGVLPLQFREGEGHEELGLTGRETFDLTGLATLQPRDEVTIAYTREDGSTGEFTVLARVDGPTELRYIHNGGILPTVLRRLYQESSAS